MFIDWNKFKKDSIKIQDILKEYSSKELKDIDYDKLYYKYENYNLRKYTTINKKVKGNRDKYEKELIEHKDLWYLFFQIATAMETILENDPYYYDKINPYKIT